jgi:hypothetical protein
MQARLCGATINERDFISSLQRLRAVTGQRGCLGDGFSVTIEQRLDFGRKLHVYIFVFLPPI